MATATNKVRRVELTVELRDRIAAIPLLATLDASTLDDGLARCPLVEAAPSVRIIAEGEYDDRFFVLIEGRCDAAIYRDSGLRGTVTAMMKSHAGGEQPARREMVIVGSLNDGDSFGELACMSPWPRSSTVFTTKKSLILEIDQDVFDDWMEASEGFKATMQEAYMARGLTTLLRGLDAFAPLGDDALRELLDGATVESFDSGRAIVREGAVGDAFYVIRGGVVAVSRLVEGGQQKTVSYLRAGSYFGEMALLDGTPRTATVTATNSTEVVRIGRDKFDAIVGRFPHAQAALRKTVSERMKAGEAVLGDEQMADALSFMAGAGILGGSDVLVIDLQRCIYCGYCEDACKSSHDVSLISLHGPSHKQFMFPTACRNCDDPRCLLQCPVDAITRARDGEVGISDHCVGCSACAVNCPYDTISLRPLSEAEGAVAQQKAEFKKQVTRQAVKCDLCDDIATGPQCVQSCPTGAVLRFKPKQLVEYILGAK